jgi:uncharacterized protein (DUF1697 family)
MLRGINVSGQKMINMQDLQALYQELCFRSVTTYIQSGNVVFEAQEMETNKLSKLIKQKLFEKYTFEVPVFVKTVSDMESIISDNLFLQAVDTDKDALYVTFLQNTPLPAKVEQLVSSKFEPDAFRISGDVIYVCCPNGYGRTKLTNTFFENKLKVTATTRNWRTVNELLKIAQQ